jgi:pyruvate dehydrogenase E1 component
MSSRSQSLNSQESVKSAAGIQKPAKNSRTDETPSAELLNRVLLRAQAHAMSMIYIANNRADAERSDPKVGGHPSACSSALHLLGLLHLVERRPEDFLAVKPHASPTNHACDYLLRLFRESNGDRMSDERARLAMKNLRHYSHTGEPVFQSYHSSLDPDNWNFLPSGSVGIPPVNALYLAEAFRMAKKHGKYSITNPHFWCLMGDSEFREGSLLEAMPEARERGLSNVTWIIDYNRQSLDGHRTHTEEALGIKDCDRIAGMAVANGWEVLQLRHGSFRKQLFAEKNGEALQAVFETALPDGELQALLVSSDAKKIVEAVSAYDKAAGKILSALPEKDVLRFLKDFGGHDIPGILEAYQYARSSEEKPLLIVAHTIKGWGLECSAKAGNHSMMIEETEVKNLLKNAGAKGDDLFAFERFEDKSEEARYLQKRGDDFFKGMIEIESLKAKNLENLEQQLDSCGWKESTPKEIGINLKLVPMAHTQWVLGQITAKLNRIGDFAEIPDNKNQKALSSDEKKWKVVGSHLITMAPDVGTSTNLNASMDHKTFGPAAQDFDQLLGTEDKSAPDITPSEAQKARHLRFEIAESNTMSCLGSFAKMADFMGVPYLPVMTVYDFFIKRALDQLFYNAYWKGNFILVGTPSGVSLSPEGAQHGWKSDIQIANMLTWEPAFGIELDWIFAETARRHLNSFRGLKEDNSEGRGAVLIRGVTRALEQKVMLERLKKQKRFAGKTDAEILESTRKDCLEGAWYIVDHRGSEGYKPGDNVVNIFTMGVMITEALAASDELLKEGYFANVINISSPDLLLGNQAYENNYQHLRQTLAVEGDLYLTKGAEKKAAVYPPLSFGPSMGDQARLSMLGAARVPVVSVHDGEPGLLDNIGSIVGVPQKALAVRHHSKSGRPSDIYKYHGIDSQSVKRACLEALNEVAWTSKISFTD